jgi:hypothetical protein
MAKQVGVKERKTVVKLTSQGGRKPKTSAMNKDLKRSYKKYRGQGK